MYCADQGVQRHLTAPYSPQQNGVVERRNQTIVGMARSLLKVKDMPQIFWGEAVSTAVFILNRSPTHSVDGMSPFEAWHGRRPNVHFMRTFGYVAHVKVVKPGAKKLDDRSKPMVFLGYQQGSKGYRVYDPIDKRVHVTRDVVFDEIAKWDWSSVSHLADNNGKDFTITYPAMSVAVPACPSTSAPEAPQPTASTSPNVSNSPVVDSLEDSRVRDFISPSSHPSVQMDNQADGLHRFKTLASVYDATTEMERDCNELFLLAGDEEPATFAEAEKEPSWRTAMLKEMRSIEENETWRLVDLPADHRPIGLKWIFKLKKDARSCILKHKADLWRRAMSSGREWTSRKPSHQ